MIQKEMQKKPSSEKEEGVSERMELPSWGLMGEFLSECDLRIERVLLHLQKKDPGVDAKQSLDAFYRDLHSLKSMAYLFSCAKLGDFFHILESSVPSLRDVMPFSKNFLAIFVNSLEVIQSFVKKIKDPDTELDFHVGSKMLALQERIRNFQKHPDHMLCLSPEACDFLERSKFLSQVTKEMHAQFMRVRVQTIEYGLNRWIQDLSEALQKKILFTVEVTEHDPLIWAALKDPLIHMIRNACDHGIERPEERKLLGKTPFGSIQVRCYREREKLVMEVSDDGKGLDRDRIAKKVIEKGWLTEAEASRRSEKEMFHFIFLPGFSTVQKVTNLSGRGMGMDVVRADIEKRGGSMEVSSCLHMGTKITMKIPRIPA